MKSVKFISAILAAVLAAASFTACSSKSGDGNSTDSTGGDSAQNQVTFDSSKEIGVISREKGSGTRGAFIELFGIEEKNEAGEKVDNTTTAAVVTDKTSVMMTTVAGDKYSIGYISLGSLNDTVKAVKIDGAAASVENIENGSYKISRPFNIVTGDDLSDAAKDFVSFIMSAEGQKVIADAGYIPAAEGEAYSASGASGKVTVHGSSSVTPVMEKLSEAYAAVNSDITVEVQQSDSSTGISDTIDKSCDIGMASRDLKDSETEKGVTGTVIATDGIAVIVNNESTVDSLTSEQVKSIFTGKTTVWKDVIGE